MYLVATKLLRRLVPTLFRYLHNLSLNVNSNLTCALGVHLQAGPCLLRAAVELSVTGILNLSDGKILAPVSVGWSKATSWKRAGSFSAMEVED